MHVILARLVPVVLVVLVAALAGGAEHGAAAFPGQNGRIAFASSRDGNAEIYVSNPDGGGQTRLTTQQATDVDPAWSPDGNRIVFTSNRSGNDDIFLMNGGGGGETRLTTDSASDVNPTWSPGARNIVFASSRDGNAEIYVMNEDGSGQTRLTNHPAPDAVPAWSPDGSRIAFTSARDGNYEIYVMNVDGANPTRLTSTPGADTSPAWSPDGRSIAFASDRDGNYEIYVMTAAGESETRLTRNLEIDLDPTWSPDGERIAFTSNRDGNYEIYVMGADGSGVGRLTAHVAEDTTPDWQAVETALPAPKPVTRASIRGAWRESAFRGVLRLEGQVPGPARVRVVLRRGGRRVLSTAIVLRPGPYRRQIALPAGLLPGRYALDVSPERSPIELTPQRIAVRLAAPPEGVVARTWVSTAVGGPPLRRLPPRTSLAFAHFRLAALPRPGRALSVWWYRPGGRRAGPPVRKARAALVVSFVETTTGAPLPAGEWRAELRAGKTIVKRLSFRVPGPGAP
jgi:Tol biopolymer transport system component